MITRPPIVAPSGGSVSASALIAAMASDPTATAAALLALGIGFRQLDYTQTLEATLASGATVTVLAGIPGKTIIPWYVGNFYTTTVAGSATNPSNYVIEYSNGQMLFSDGGTGRTTNQAPGTYFNAWYSSNRALAPHVGTGLDIRIRGQAGPGIGALLRTGRFLFAYYTVTP